MGASLKQDMLQVRLEIISWFYFDDLWANFFFPIPFLKIQGTKVKPTFEHEQLSFWKSQSQLVFGDNFNIFDFSFQAQWQWSLGYTIRIYLPNGDTDSRKEF